MHEDEEVDAEVEQEVDEKVDEEVEQEEDEEEVNNEVNEEVDKEVDEEVYKTAYRHIPTMTDSHHGGFLPVMIMVGICQVTKSHHSGNSEEAYGDP